MQIIISLGGSRWDIQIGVVALVLAAWVAWELAQRVRSRMGGGHGS